MTPDDAVKAARFMEVAATSGARRRCPPRRFALSGATWAAIVEWLGPLHHERARVGTWPSYMGVEVWIDDALVFGRVIVTPGEPQLVPHVWRDGSVTHVPVARDESGGLPHVHEVELPAGEGMWTRVGFALREWERGPVADRLPVYVEGGMPDDVLTDAMHPRPARGEPGA